MLFCICHTNKGIGKYQLVTQKIVRDKNNPATIIHIIRIRKSADFPTHCHMATRGAYCYVDTGQLNLTVDHCCKPTAHINEGNHTL